MIHSDDIIFDKEKAEQKETIHKTNHRKRKLTEEPEVNTTKLTFVFRTILQVIQTKISWVWKSKSSNNKSYRVLLRIWCTTRRNFYLQLHMRYIYRHTRPHKDEWFEFRPRKLQLLFYHHNSGGSNSFNCFSRLCMLNEVS